MKTYLCYEEGDLCEDAAVIHAESIEDAAEEFISGRGFHEDGDFRESIVLVREIGGSGEWRRFQCVPEATVVVHVYEEEI